VDVTALAWLLLFIMSVWHILVSRASIPSMELTQPHIQLVPAFLPSGREVAHSHPVSIFYLYSPYSLPGCVFRSSTELCINIFFQQTSFPNRLQFYYTRFYKVHTKLNCNYSYYSVKMFSRLPNLYYSLKCSSQRVCTFRWPGLTVPPVCPTYNMAWTRNVRLWSVTDWRTKSLVYWSHGKQVRKCPQSETPVAL